MSPVFTPPATTSVAPVLARGDPEQTALGYRLFRHYPSGREGVNVYVLSDGTVTESDPDGTRVVWSPDDRNGEAINAIWVTHVFWGGCDNQFVTDEIAALLTGAGYTVDVGDEGAQLEEDGSVQLAEDGSTQLLESA